MKIIIASDIHGSAFYCRKLIEAFHKEEAQTLLLLGDILDGSNEVAKILNELNKNFKRHAKLAERLTEID